MKTSLKFAVVLSGLFVASVAQAQGPRAPAQGPVFNEPAGGSYSNAGFGGYGGYFGSYYSSTPAEGFFRGWGFAVQSLGEYQRLNAIANRHNQEARSRALDNDYKATETYFARRRLNAYEVRELRGPAPTTESHLAVNQARSPGRLSASQISRTSGKLFWPVALEDELFTDMRLSVNELFAARAAAQMLDTRENTREIRQLVGMMRDELKAHIEVYPADEYVAAKKFLDSLAYETTFPAMPFGLAAR